MPKQEKLDFVGICTRIIFDASIKDPGSIFKIALFKDIKTKKTYNIKGDMAIKVRKQYKIQAHDSKNEKYSDQYDADDVRYDIDLEKATPRELRNFISNFTSEKRAKALSELPDIIKVLNDGDIDTLTSIDGIGESTAKTVLEGYNEQKDYSEAYIFFADYELTKKTIKKVCEHFKGVTTAIAKIEEDPYNLIEVTGFGFKKADEAFLMYCKNTGKSTDDPRRSKAYVDHLFDEEYQKGNTWIKPKDLVNKLMDALPNTDIHKVIKYINTSDKFRTLNVKDNKYGEACKRVVTKKNLILEMSIANELRRIAMAKTRIDLHNVDNIIKMSEREQGWEYADEQKHAINAMLKNNVIIIQGTAGSGKSSAVRAYIDVLRANNYSFAQCALSGRAADNLSQVTLHHGSTIHSLIQYGRKESYDKKNPLPYDVVVLDEISMVDDEIFLALLNAIPKGGKLIMLGDSGQLDSIGAGVMTGMINSYGIPIVSLKEIHRQAKNSAIITHSIEYRKGSYPKELKFKPNVNSVYGVNKDLKYCFVDNKSEDQIAKVTLQEFNKSMENFDVDDIQIICPTKSAGATSTFKLNAYCQLLVNPQSPDKNEIKLGKDKTSYILREGDKIINVKNNRKVKDENREDAAIWNGNTGKLIKIINSSEGSFLYGLAEFDGIGKIILDKKAIKSIQLGYAITCHKVQGSTIPCVILALPFHYLLNSRELVYTGVTRASKYQVIVTSPKTFKAALKKTSKRKEKTNLAMFIRELNIWKKELGIKLED